eukprot:4552413-Pyramimonas_sp.AAC.1
MLRKCISFDRTHNARCALYAVKVAFGISGRALNGNRRLTEMGGITTEEKTHLRAKVLELIRQDSQQAGALYGVDSTAARCRRPCHTTNLPRAAPYSEGAFQQASSGRSKELCRGVCLNRLTCPIPVTFP